MPRLILDVSHLFEVKMPYSFPKMEHKIYLLITNLGRARAARYIQVLRAVMDAFIVIMIFYFCFSFPIHLLPFLTIN